MTRLKKLLRVMRYYALLRLDTRALEGMSTDIFDTICRLKEELNEIRSNISYRKWHNMPTATEEEDVRECEEYLVLLRADRRLVLDVLKAKAIRKPAYAS